MRNIFRQFSHFVIANIQFIKCLALFLAPGLVAIFVSNDESREQWKHVFIVLGMVLIIVRMKTLDKNEKFRQIFYFVPW